MNKDLIDTIRSIALGDRSHISSEFQKALDEKRCDDCDEVLESPEEISYGVCFNCEPVEDTDDDSVEDDE